MLKLLQARLRELWTNEQYSAEFNAYPAAHRDFDHALKHVLKAAVALQNMCEEADHGSHIGWPRAQLEKFLADLTISTARAANMAPCGPIDLEESIRHRIRRKMKAEL